MSAPQTVVITRLSALGDIILTLPAVDALAAAWPDTRLVYVTHRAFAPVLRQHPNIRHVVPFERGWGIWDLKAALKPFAPFALCDLHGKWRGMLLRLLYPNTQAVRWHKRQLAQTLRMRLGDGRYIPCVHVTKRYHTAVERLVGRPLPSVPLRYGVAQQDLKRMATLLKQLQQGPTRGFVGVSPGAQWQSKRWPEQSFVLLAQRLVRMGYTILWTGSPQEATWIASLAQRVPGSINFVAQSPLGDLGAMIAQCCLFVTNDSGPMHMARALRVPTLAFFGSTSPYQFDANGHAMLFSGRDCAPCSFHGRIHCPRGHTGCMTDLSVDLALEHARYLLQQGRAPEVWG